MQAAPTTTFYHQQILKIRAEVYPDDAVIRQIVQAKAFIDRHFFAAIDLNDIAGKTFNSRFHFIRLFKAVYGRTPHQYLVAVRIIAARKLLRKGVSVKQACVAVGFASAHAVSGLLKRMAGKSSAERVTGETAVRRIGRRR
ncbi:AraC family transcriptional regulator [Fulvivirgaceae bacterium PWU5]|uniref:AraC family transcriptional regulator n=1 Tax=Dawidia cretensis TaxID=2782350 RepID=A0AAP2GUT9_9BACT|nr:AraC family transcriptional regulator [Dawidia cretensis]MBT1709963.1 AraC family transcriptional regulator [Dawidia cretensis]